MRRTPRFASASPPRPPQTRTVVKARFRALRFTGGPANGRRNAAATANLKVHLDYVAHRPDVRGERAFREVFTAHDVHGASGGREAKHELHRVVEDARETYAYQLVLSPGRDLNEAQLRAWTRAVLQEAGLSKYLAAAHAGETAHTAHPHVHVIAFTNQRLSRETLLGMRLVGDAECDKTLRMTPQMRDLSPEHLEVAAERGSGGGREPDVESGSARQKKQAEINALDFE